jgi:hypothetical protein
MPFIKQQAVTALTGDYQTTPQAMQGIQRTLREFYAKYPQVQMATVNSAVTEVQRIFTSSTFPEMKVTWRTHPDNIGHYYFNGCFRCHDGQHVSPAGKVLTSDCNVCHTVLNQEAGRAQTSITGVKLDHPGGDLPEGVKCMECHTGGVGP